MSKIEDLRVQVKNIVRSSPYGKTLIADLEKQYRILEGENLQKFARENGFSSTKQMLQRWSEDFNVVGQDCASSVEVKVPNHIQEMNKSSKTAAANTAKFNGFLDGLKEKRRERCKGLCSSTSTSNENTLDENEIPTSMQSLKIITEKDSNLKKPRSLDLSKTIVLRLLDVINPHRFWFVEVSDYQQLNQLMENMQDFYNKENDELAISPKLLRKGLFLAVKYATMWHRGRILETFPEGALQILCVDFGTVVKIESNDEIRYLLKSYFDYPCFAQRGTLSHIQPIGDKWTDECINFFKENLNRRLIEAKIFKKNTRDSSYQMAIKAKTNSSKENVLITNELIDKKWCESDAKFLEKDSVNPNELEFEDYEAGRYFKEPVVDETWLPKVLSHSTKEKAVSTSSNKSGDLMKAILKTGITTSVNQRRRRIEMPSKERNIVCQSFTRLPERTILKVYIHVVREVSEFYFYLMDEFTEIFEYLENLNEVYAIIKDSMINEDFTVGTDVVTFADDNFCRARIINKLEKDSFELMLVDFGITVQRSKKEILKLKDEFKDRQAAVYTGKLENIPEHFFLKTSEQLLERVRSRSIEIKIQSIVDKVAIIALINV